MFNEKYNHAVIKKKTFIGHLVNKLKSSLLQSQILFCRDFVKNSHCPLVFVLSDNAGGESNERLLFPKDLQLELKITNIRFRLCHVHSLLFFLMHKVNFVIQSSYTASRMSCSNQAIQFRVFITPTASLVYLYLYCAFQF